LPAPFVTRQAGDGGRRDGAARTSLATPVKAHRGELMKAPPVSGEGVVEQRAGDAPAGAW
jgi:hypothetical protein